MAKKKAKATKRPSKPAPRKKTIKKTIKKATRAVRKPLTKKKKAAPRRKVVAKRVAPKKAVKKPVKKAVKKPVKKVGKKAPLLPVPARLQRERKRLPEAEDAFEGQGADSRLLRSARSGHDELRHELQLHTEGGPELTAGDVDAKWQDAYAVGDEAPGGDNMTPDQDRVDDIGKAMGVVYDDDEELMGGEEINERDVHRWELDPASKEDEEI